MWARLSTNQPSKLPLFTLVLNELIASSVRALKIFDLAQVSATETLEFMVIWGHLEFVELPIDLADPNPSTSTRLSL